MAGQAGRAGRPRFPTPRSKKPTDAIIKVTSTNICGSDLHLYETLTAFMTAGRRARPRGDGRGRRGGPEARLGDLAVGDRVVVPFQMSCGHCFMCDERLYSQCETTQVTRVRHRRRAVRVLEALRRGARRAGRIPARAAGRSSPTSRFPTGPADERFVYLSDVLPTAWQAVAYAGGSEGRDAWSCSGSGPIGDMSTRIAQPPGLSGDRRRSRARAPGAGSGPRCRGRSTCASTRRISATSSATDRRPRRRLGHRRGRHGGARLAGAEDGAGAGRAAARRRSPSR